MFEVKGPYNSILVSLLPGYIKNDCSQLVHFL